MKKREKNQRFGLSLIAELCQTFEFAYTAHQRGKSELELLIPHDIIAAGTDTDPVIVSAHRKAIRSAVDAFDKGVPMAMARAYMEKQLRAKLQTMLDA
jgi:hypothetical protein